MFTIVAVLAGLGMLATLGTLVAGMLGIARGDGSPRRSNRLMQMRVLIQGVTLLLLLLLVLMSRH